MKILCGEVKDIKSEFGKVNKLMPGVKPITNKYMELMGL